jgi:hypothetical protein
LKTKETQTHTENLEDGRDEGTRREDQEKGNMHRRGARNTVVEPRETGTQKGMMPVVELCGVQRKPKREERAMKEGQEGCKEHNYGTVKGK